MARHTGNRAVIEKLQEALQAFLEDHRKAAEQEPEWVEETETMNPEEPGCGCNDCQYAGYLLGSIY